MCLYIKKTQLNKELYEITLRKVETRKKYKDSVMKLASVAKSDMQVFKILRCDRTGNLAAPHQNMKYELGKPVSSKLAVDNSYCEISIGKGMHSFTNMSAVNTHKRQHIGSGTTVTLDAIVPKGSTYFVGRRGDIASSSLEILDNDKNKNRISRFIKKSTKYCS